MGNPMKIRAANKDGVTELKVLVSHEMETGQRIRVLFDQDGNHAHVGQAGSHADRHDGAVFGDIRAGDLNILAIGRRAGAQRLQCVGHALGVEGSLVPVGQGHARGDDAGGCQHAQQGGAGAGFEYGATLIVHDFSSVEIGITWNRSGST